MSIIDPFSWNLKSEEVVFDKHRKLAKRVYEMPDGTTNDWYVSLDRPSAHCLALTEKNEVILFKQFRPGPQQIMYELPGGAVDEGEEPITAANRELLEETGYSGDALVHLISAHKDAYSSGIWHGYITKNCKIVDSPKRGAMEFGEVALVSIDEFKKIVKKGQLSDVITGYAGLDYLNAL